MFWRLKRRYNDDLMTVSVKERENLFLRRPADLTPDEVRSRVSNYGRLRFDERFVES